MSAEIAEKIRRYRLRKKLTQLELADAAGVSVRVISSIEAGEHSTRIDTLEAVVGALGREMGDLFPIPPAAKGADVLSQDFKESPTARDVGTLVDRFLEAPPDHRAMVMAILFEDASLAASFDWSALELRLVKRK